MELFLVLVIFILGLCVGSFLNVVIDRLPKGESIVKGRSYCDKCRKKLKWYDLIPLFSFLVLKRKCRNCNSSISFYYPIVELTTGLLFVFVFFTFNNFQFSSLRQGFVEQAALVFQLFLISSLVVIFFTDLKYEIIPDAIVFPSVFIVFAYLFLNHGSLFFNYFLTAGGAFLFFLLLFLITRGRGMGFGDVKFSFLMGLLLGFPKIVVSLYLAFLTGALISLILVIWGKKKFIGGTIPFGPFLVLGTLISLFFADKILKLASPFLP
ncbi:MAG: prepilin peptidase [Candidatus Levybacteria bacterium]|nr:prepilin peptidase [Candidatus Levybacteria bacterium]